MTNYVLVSHGGSMPETPEEGVRFMQAWTDWYDELGARIVDRGNPMAVKKQIAPDGYIIIRADSLDEAVALAKGCPVLGGGSTLQVVETYAMM
jgi:hypothetical protein